MSEPEITLVFPHEEVRFLKDVVEVLANVGEPGDDLGARRLTPSVYPDDPDASDEWLKYAGTELDTARRADRSAYELIFDRLLEDVDLPPSGSDDVAVVDDQGDENDDDDAVDLPRVASIDVSRAEAAAILRVVNDARLVLGARWGVETADDMEGLDEARGAVLDHLGYFQSLLTDLLSQLLDTP